MDIPTSAVVIIIMYHVLYQVLYITSLNSHNRFFEVGTISFPLRKMKLREVK